MKAGRYLIWAQARQLVAALEAALTAGCTVYVCTYTRATKITPACYARWQASGRPLFRASMSGAYMASGRTYVCIDYCSFRID